MSTNPHSNHDAVDGQLVRRRIRVAVMMLTLASGRMGGTEVYAENLVANLRALNDDRFDITVVRAEQRHTASSGQPVSTSSPVIGRTDTRSEHFRDVTVPFLTAGVTHGQKLLAWLGALTRRRRVWSFIERAAGGPVDIAFYPFTAVQPQPPTSTKPVVVVHDLQHLDMPSAFTVAQRWYRRLAYELPGARASAIVTVSDFTSASVIEHLRVSREKIHRVYPGIDTDLFRPGQRTVPADPVLYYPARGLPHKNHARLFRAVERVRQAHPNLTLILSGSDESSLHPLPDFVVHVGNITPTEIRDLYRGVTAVVFPSLYEGFGFPPLEALATGTPVVASRAGALPEVLAESAILVDQHSVESIAAGIELALTQRIPSGGTGTPHASSTSHDPNAARAPQSVAAFTWSKTAEDVLSVLAELSATNRPDASEVE